MNGPRVPVGGEGFDGPAYQSRFDALARQGLDVHGEANLVTTFGPGAVLDAGCGTGRVAIELARRGIDVVGVDRDESMLAEARRLGPDLEWIRADLAGLDLGRDFELVVLAGNVPLFTPSADRESMVRACARHVAPGGRLLAGFQLDRGYDLAAYDAACSAEGLEIEERWSTWDRAPLSPEDGYAVSAHRRPASR
ncbi:MAG: class I SAM-dependent methyltransferase [Acidimicrobiales bacterium]